MYGKEIYRIEKEIEEVKQGRGRNRYFQRFQWQEQFKRFGRLRINLMILIIYFIFVIFQFKFKVLSVYVCMRERDRQRESEIFGS